MTYRIVEVGTYPSIFGGKRFYLVPVDENSAIPVRFAMMEETKT